MSEYPRVSDDEIQKAIADIRSIAESEFGLSGGRYCEEGHTLLIAASLIEALAHDYHDARITLAENQKLAVCLHKFLMGGPK